MLRSMTGYGRGEAAIGGRRIVFEIKSVNHKFFEFNSRITRGYLFLEDKLKAYVQDKISRGKVEVSLMVRAVERSDTNIEADLPLAKNYYAALGQIARALGLENNADALSIARFDGVLTRVKNEEDTESLWLDVKTVLHKAMEEFIAMRRAEGEKLRLDVMSRLDTIQKRVEKIEKEAPDRVAAYQERLYTKLKTILEDTGIDQARILTEAALFADRVAVDEEITRLYSHISQYRDILSGDRPRGRKLDFLTQEMNRETNTIGSKSNDLSITNTVVDIKTEIEKIREQIQNIE